MREITVEAKGGRIRCLTAGTGKPLLLCHGFLSSAEEFGGRFTALAERRQLVIPDLPGNAGSSPLTARHTSAELAAALDELMVKLGIVEFDVAGLCLGASVACELTRRRKGAVERLLLHTPLVAPALIRPFYRAQVAVATIPPVWRTVAALSRNRTVSNLYKRFVIAEGDVDQRTADANFDNQLRVDISAAREWLSDGRRSSAGLEVLRHRTSPTLVVVAQHDHIVNTPRLSQLIAGNPHIRLVIDSAQGHGWNADAVEGQLGLMREFFGSGEPPRSSSLEASVAV